MEEKNENNIKRKSNKDCSFVRFGCIAFCVRFDIRVSNNARESRSRGKYGRAADYACGSKRFA